MKKDALIFLTGGIIYPIMEIVWRGYSHYSMAIAGGLSLVLINRVCCTRLNKKRMYVKCAAGSLIITAVEFAVGIIFNKILLMEVWDYSQLPMNILGQISLPFSLIWFFITIPAIFVCTKITAAVDSRSVSAGEEPGA